MLCMVCLLFICLPTSARPRAHRRSADTFTLVLAGRMSPAQWTLVHPDCPRGVALSYGVAVWSADLPRPRSPEQAKVVAHEAALRLSENKPS
jgi:hypothetical protein